MVECLEHELTNSCSVTGAARYEYCEQIPELYLRAMVDSYSSGVAVLDEIGTILYVNRPWREFAVQHGLRADFYGVGHNYLEARRRASDALVEQSEALAEGINQVLMGRETGFQEEYLSRNSIPRRWIRIHAARFDLPRAVRVLVTHEDVTESRRTGEARHIEAERLQRLLNVTHVLTWEADFATSRFTSVSEQAVNMFGYPAEEWYQSDFLPAHLHPDDRERAIARCIDCSNAQDNFELEYRMIAKDGRVVWLHNLVSVIREDGRPRTIQGFAIDVTASKLIEATLRDLSGRLIHAQEEERRRVARELHDDVNQRMALLSIELEQLGQVAKPLDLHRRLKGLQDQVQEISADIHRLSYKLHPSQLDHLGLAAAVKSLCENLSAKGTIKVELQQSGLPANLSKDVTLCVFRITQEALGNCVRHSGAEKARVMIETISNEIHLSVSDDGCGFEMDSETMKKGL
ncbi:MAG: PAS domain-containing protein, partial [Pyrinomonadaceae bacterium]|nr:PAS domain-containing protein [Pyrinomonadaceae bacterium]